MEKVKCVRCGREAEIEQARKEDWTIVQRADRRRGLLFILCSQHGKPEKEAGLDATPQAVELAQEYGLDLAMISGSGAGGRILVSDVRAVISKQQD